MATKKITLNELRSIVKQIIKENNEFRDMDSSDIAAEEDNEIDAIYKEQLYELYDFEKFQNICGEFETIKNKEMNNIIHAIKNKFSKKDEERLHVALWELLIPYYPSRYDMGRELKDVVKMVIKK